MKESAKSSEVTRPDMSSLQINLITPCARATGTARIMLKELKVMSTVHPILHFSCVPNYKVLSASVRAGPLLKGKPRKLHTEIHTQHCTNIVP